MKFNIIKLTILCCVAFVSTNVFAQDDFQGKAYYQSKTSADMSRFEREGMSEDIKKRIADRMKNMFEKEYVLTFNKTESIYKEEEKLAAPTQGGGGGRFASMMSSFAPGLQYKNVKEAVLLQDQEFFGKQFLIKDPLEKLEWVMSGETKQIGKYMCFKATTQKVIADSGISNFGPRGRGGDNNDDAEKKKEEEAKEPKAVEVVAWYTMQIPVNQGPGDYWGLPGLILEINAGKTTILCSKIVLNPTEKDNIKRPSKGKEVTKEEYNKIVKKKTEEMRENFRGRGGRGGGGRR
ncbi:MAG: GLPGLI family protein [Algibacter sp.]